MRLSVVAAILLLASPALAEEREPETEKKRAHSFEIESVEVAFSSYEQRGKGYQSKANSKYLTERGDAGLTVLQPQVLVVARQNEHIVHRFWVPIDFVTSASANAIDRGRNVDVVTNSSRQNESIAFNWRIAYEAAKWQSQLQNDVHIEENFRSWAAGLGAQVSLADDNLTLAGNVNEVLDWFSGYDGLGFKTGRVNRSTSNVNGGITQILTPYTVVHANYGVSFQSGQLSNTWNTVPFVTGDRFAEKLPSNRWRHAVVGRFAQWLPWDGALKGFYRFYADNWGVVAHAFEGQLLQRVFSNLYVRASYRYYTQTPVDFFTTLTDGLQNYFTADSDLARFDSQTVGAKLVADFPWVFNGAHVDAGYERYWRTDGLRVNMGIFQAGARF
ncbi:MAG: DUF3570 domain-containing protein [Labilithrix sp.]